MARIDFSNPGSKEYKACFGVGNNEVREDAQTSEGTASVYQGERFLIIGLGGQGVVTVDLIKKMAQKRFANIRAKDCQVIFAALDTNGPQLEATCLEQGVETFQIPILPTAEDHYSYTHTIGCGIPRDEFTARWINPQFEYGFPKNGAGQNRHASKAIFHDEEGGTSTAQNIERFLQQRLTSLRSTNNGVHVFVVTGLAGGTGSGSFVELSQMLHRAFRSVYGKTQISLKVDEFFYLPDVIEQFFEPGKRPSIYANAYAALKEMDYYYSAKQRTFGADYLEARNYDNDNWEVSSRSPLFDTAYLVSGSNGVIATDNKNKQAIQTVSEAIINLIADAQVTVGEDFRSTDSNRAKQRQDNILPRCYDNSGNEDPKVCADDSFVYTSVGTASLSILENPIKMYMISHTMRTISGKAGGFIANDTKFRGFNNEPISASDAETKIADLRLLTPDQVIEKIREICKLLWAREVDIEVLCNTQNNKAQYLVSRNDEITARDKQGRKSIPYDEVYNLAVGAFNEYIEKELAETKRSLLAFMKQDGPAALYWLYKGIGIDGKYPKDVSIEDKLDQYGDASFQRKSYKSQYETALDRGRKAMRRWLGIIPRDQRAIKSELSKVICDMNQEDLVARLANHAFGIDGQKYQRDYLNKLKEYFEKIHVFSQSLDALYDAYDNLGQAFETGAVVDKQTTSKSILKDDMDFRWAKDVIDRQADLIEFQHVKDAIIKSFGENSDVWTEFDPQNPTVSPRMEMDHIMSEQNVTKMGNELKLVNLFANRIANDPSWQNWLEDLLRNTLIPTAEPLYRSKALGPVAQKAEKFLLVPSSLTAAGAQGNQINTALNRICQGGNGKDPVSISYISLDNSITCYSGQFALPLYSLEDLARWETAYETTQHKDQHSNESGKGLYDPEKGVAWVDYPALCLRQNPRIPDVTTGEVSREGRFFKNTIDPLFEDMKKLGLLEQIERDDGKGTVYYSYRCYLMTKLGWDWEGKFDYKRYAAAPGVKDANGFVQGGMKLVAYLAEQNGGSIEDLGVSVDIRFGNHQESFTENCTTQEIAEDRAKRVLRRNIPLLRAMKATKTLYEKLAVEIEKQNNEIRYQTVGRDMLWLIANGMIVRDYGTWYMQNYAYEGENVELLDTDPIAVEGDWRFDGKYRFEYLALRDAFVEKYGRDENVFARIQEAKDYILAKDAEPQQKKTVREQRRAEFLNRLGVSKEEAKKGLFREEAEVAQTLKGATCFQERRALTQRIGMDIMTLLNDYDTGVTAFYKNLEG